ncbi:cytosolic phospholipase A2 zeta-like [Eublepharis macularius]|uniref:Phospholipase A2 n=1 Tax=Eublepharis macularius TaxID=481883 RepID=A0AA97IUN9_EUBMA|nr:cytosolic phospholipase A2 zeta-like [Eublepharis macularius]
MHAVEDESSVSMATNVTYTIYNRTGTNIPKVDSICITLDGNNKKSELHPFYNLKVKVLRARNIHGLDLLSKADCYVALKLPTASPLVKRTQVVYNSSDPEWNETFEYRIHSAVKNVLEFTFYNRDIVLSGLSSHATSITFDIENIVPGETLHHTFVLNSQEKRAELDVEFHLEESPDPPSEVLTNGILVVHPCLRIQGTINKNKKRWILKENCLIKLSVPGSFENYSSTFCGSDSDKMQKIPFVFHVHKDIFPELKLDVVQTAPELEEGWSEDLHMKTSLVGNGSIPLSQLPLGKEVDLSVPIGKEQSVDLTVKVEENPEDIDVHLSSDLSKGEREFLERRKEIISPALKKILGLDIAPRKNEVPIVAVLASGGGMRAMTGCYGNLLGLQQLGLLHVLTYFCGVSGSIWCMATLYKDSHWSNKDLQDAIKNARTVVTNTKVGAFSAEQLAYYFQELVALEKTGRKTTLVDLWGLIIEYILNKKKDPAKLSDQQEAVRWGQNPYPIYAAQSVRTNVSSSEFTEWCEYTPYEFGIHKYQASINIEDYGSKFFMGSLREKHEEPRICFLHGIWASAFAANIDDIWEETFSSEMKFIDSLKDAFRAIDELRGYQSVDPAMIKTWVIMPGGAFTQLFNSLFKSRITSGEIFNFLQGMNLHRDYVNDKQFVAWKEAHLDAVPNQLTPGEESLHLVDAGLAINSAFPLVVMPERDVDLILSLNYSWQAPFEVLHQAQRYCEDRGIPFPHIVVTEHDRRNPKECYMYLHPKNPKAPIVLHFPLVNNTFRKYKAPGIKRETEEEKSYGDFHVHRERTPYGSINLTFSPTDFDRLLDLSYYNIINNKDAILNALSLALKRRKLKQQK